MKLLLTNDDGVHSEALLRLAAELSKIAQVTVVAPRTEQSGVSNAFSFYKPLNVRKVEGFPCEAYSLAGTPADCVKFAVCKIMADSLPDLVISGINDGENTGISVIYSGTIAAAREGATWGIPSIAISMQKLRDEFYGPCLDWISAAVQNQWQRYIAPNTCWSVNFPATATPKDLRVCAMDITMFNDKYITHTNPRGLEDYWLVGRKDRSNFVEDADDWWLYQGHPTLTPLQLDQSSLSEIERLRNLLTPNS